ncbi:hypothetical protein F511_32474 [Dorcoceras hygrometricum]|uniref:Uncharacterized protein n=1 Tax=Dorcoceras hygrometricum TaxID=472368 RepID=A0A2Z7B300_9LAMI|nr:hypothetical protein F511_32474 [Dorcoceras hygrometricum]
MNFLMMRSHSQTAIQEPSSSQETQAEVNYESRPTTTLEGLFSDDSFPENTPSRTRYAENHEYEGENSSSTSTSGESNSQVNSHIDVEEDDGFIIIPYKEVPEKWMEAPDILSLCSLDRKFVFPGEQIHILICLSACKQDTEIITPFKVAAVMNKNWIGKGNNKTNGDVEGPEDPVTLRVDMSACGLRDQNGMDGVESHDVPTGESLLRMEDYKRQTKRLLQKFKSSHFFARIAESHEPLWTKRRAQKANHASSETFEKISNGDSLETEKIMKKKNSINAAIDRGNFDARTSGGLVRDVAKCCSLPNGDIVVLLQVNISVEFVRDPILEILQFEMYQERNSVMDNQHAPASERLETSGDLLKWLLPVDNSSLPPTRAVSPPVLSSSSSIRNTSTKPSLSGSSGSQLFSFGNFRSYSMSSLPPNSTPPPSVTTPNAKPSFEPEDWNQFSFRKFVESGRSGHEGLLSFRGVPLEPERFSVRCGLEGSFTPGRRWRKKIEIIQPVEINSVSFDCNTDDLLCVHVKNISPEYASDIVVFIDAITIIFEETSTDGPPLNLPITCIEAGNDYHLPNLALRRGEEHSFILKPATSLWKGPKGNSGSNLQPSRMPAGSAASGSAASSRQNHYISEGKHGASSADHYAILVSCRCNYTESKLFFKQKTSWRPRISRDLMISVASEMSKQTLGSDGTQLPVQVLTLQASNLTSDVLTLTVLAPASFTSPPSVVSLSNSPSSPLSSFASSVELSERATTDSRVTAVRHLGSVPLNHGLKVEDGVHSVLLNEELSYGSDVVPSNDLGCTHLWLQSRVPLGSVPAHSMATIKLEVLPLTDGIITLDSLQIDVKEKGEK